jgi:hypothetical protein
LNKRTIIVSGMVASDPFQGGASWAVLQYLLGLRRLGHDAYLIEPLNASSIQPPHASLAASANAAYFRQTVAQFDLQDRCALLLNGTEETAGLTYAELKQIAKRADVLLNVSGLLQQEFTSDIPVRVYLDLDPAFNQLWHSTQGIDMRFEGHTHFATVGQAIGSEDCGVPTCGHRWIHTLPPIALEHYSTNNPILYDAFTTIANWRGYGSIEHGGVFYGQKAHSVRRFIELPKRTPQQFLLALSIHPDETRDTEALARNGWRLLDPVDVAGTPQRYMQFVMGSKAEFGIAKSGYVASRCGWFSDRSASYLAFGRPVIAQETGFSAFVPSGEGLFGFDTEEDVLMAIEKITGDYERQSQAARTIAQEYFEAGKVLSRLLVAVGAQ